MREASSIYQPAGHACALHRLTCCARRVYIYIYIYVCVCRDVRVRDYSDIVTNKWYCIFASSDYGQGSTGDVVLWLYYAKCLCGIPWGSREQ